MQNPHSESGSQLALSRTVAGRRWQCLLSLTLIVLGGSFLYACYAQGRKSADAERLLMRKKLEFTQSLLAGLTEGNFEKIISNAQAMDVLGYLEKWKRADQEDYRRQLLFFNSANHDIIHHAKAKNLDGALLAYNQLTISCVQCHKYMRSGR